MTEIKINDCARFKPRPNFKSKMNRMNSDKLSQISNRLKNIETMLDKIINKQNEKRIEDVKSLKWKYAAIVIDRLFFFLSLIYFVLTFLPIILTAKNFYKPH